MDKNTIGIIAVLVIGAVLMNTDLSINLPKAGQLLLITAVGWLALTQK